jgi:peptidoglycan/xylan/chitin deacetylase (PgdA/CDA1 family)
MSIDVLVEMAPEWRAEREYVLSVLLGDWLGITFAVRIVDGLPETRLRLAADADSPTVVLPDCLLSRTTDWLSAGSLPPSLLPTVVPPDWTGILDPVPVLYASLDGAGPLMHRDGSRFVVTLDVLGSVLFLLSRYEEYVNADRSDRHDRFPADASVMAAGGWLQWPVADMYFGILAGVLRLAWPGLPLTPSRYEPCVVGHDVDHPSSPRRWHGMDRARIVAGDLVRRHDIGLAIRRTSSFMGSPDIISRHDPFNTYDLLMRTTERAGIRGTFFFLTRHTDVPDGTRYRIDDAWAQRLIAAMARRGHTIGLHGSYNSSADALELRQEWDELQRVVSVVAPDALRRTIRQHYLRWRPGETWRAQAEAGLETDETLGFADSIGYRAGTARSFMAFDLAERRQLPLRVKPLHVMDATLLQYLSIGNAEAIEMVGRLAERSRRYGGSLSLLWHNSSLETQSTRDLYVQLVALLTAPGEGP